VIPCFRQPIQISRNLRLVSPVAGGAGFSLVAADRAVVLKTVGKADDGRKTADAIAARSMTFGREKGGPKAA
jgi:hypothetical protein